MVKRARRALERLVERYLVPVSVLAAAFGLAAAHLLTAAYRLAAAHLLTAAYRLAAVDVLAAVHVPVPGLGLGVSRREAVGSPRHLLPCRRPRLSLWV